MAQIQRGGAKLQGPRHRDDWLSYFSGLRDGGEEICLYRVCCVVQSMRQDKSLSADKLAELKAPALQRSLSQRLSELGKDFEDARWHRLKTYGLVQKDLPATVSTRSLQDFFGQQLMAPSDSGELPALKRRIPLACALLIVEILMDLGLLQVNGVADPSSEQRLADALHRFFAASERTRRELHSQFVGDYFVYRRSAHWPGRIVKARLQVGAIPIEGTAPPEMALRALERHIHTGPDGSAPAAETYVGVLSRKGSYTYILSSLTDKDGQERGAPRFTLIHSTVFRDGPRTAVVSMVGSTVSPFAQGHIWTSAVCIERTDGESPDDALGIFDVTDLDAAGKRRIPASVVARLDAFKG